VVSERPNETAEAELIPALEAKLAVKPDAWISACMLFVRDDQHLDSAFPGA
jgi:hypothetical protein